MDKFIKATNITKKFYSLRNGWDYVFHKQNVHFPFGKNIGLLGLNGAGKTVLLKILSKAESLNEGKLEISGSVSWPVGVSAGLDPALTGKENIDFICSALGITEIDEVTKEVAERANLLSFMDKQVKNYSSGMQARLAFFLCFVVDFDFYLADEITAVGDDIFKQKAEEFMKNKTDKSTLILTSHSIDHIREHCEIGCVIDKGKISPVIDIEESIRYYQEVIDQGMKDAR
tara:strand:- start:6765 stop:7454 length:690 start_codon:yes stop_codon:yes gene_type:complete